MFILYLKLYAEEVKCHNKMRKETMNYEWLNLYAFLERIFQKEIMQLLCTIVKISMYPQLVF